MTQTEYLRVTDELEDIYYIEVNYPNDKRELIQKLISYAIEELTGSDNWRSYDSGIGNDMDAFVGWTNEGIIFERYE